MENICFIALGSNRESPHYMEEAQRILTKEFPDIRFSRILKTRPINFCAPDFFFNQTAVFHTDQTEEKIVSLLKGIERDMGRLPEDKSRGIVRIDLDLLIFNHKIRKPDDLSRCYVKEGMKELHSGTMYTE